MKKKMMQKKPLFHKHIMIDSITLMQKLSKNINNPKPGPKRETILFGPTKDYTNYDPLSIA